MGEAFATVIEASNPARVGKTYHLDKDKKLSKTAVASIAAGAATTIQATPAKMVAALKRAAESENTVIALDAFKGAAPGSPAAIKIVTESRLEYLTGGPIGEVHPGFFQVKGQPYSARLKRLMNNSGWILLDGDCPEGMPPEWAKLSLPERLELFEAVLPGISTCLRIEYRGSSARVVETGAPEPGPTHALIMISDPGKLDTLRVHAHIESVRKGLAFRSLRYSRKDPGKVIGYSWLTLLDWSVWGSGRLIFSAKPDVTGAPGFLVLDANVRIVNPNGGALNIDKLEPPDEAALRDFGAKTNLKVSVDSIEVDGEKQFAIREEGKLRLDTDIESRGQTGKLAQWLERMLDNDVDKHRIEAPFRSSVSGAAFIRIAPSGQIFVHDMGTSISHVLEPLPRSVEDARTKAPTAGMFNMMKMVIEARERRSLRQAQAIFQLADGDGDDGNGDGNGGGTEPADEPEENTTQDNDNWDNAPEFSDEDLALRFAAEYAYNLRFVAAMGRWFIWNGKRWAADEKRAAFSLSRQVCRAAARDCRKKNIAKSLASAKTVAAVEKLAQADPKLAASVDIWDANPWLLNTPDGIVDLHTGDLRPHSAADYMTKITAVGPGGACPRFEQFMTEIMDGDAEMVSFIQRLLGYCLTGDISEEVLFFFHGAGQNGKGVLTSTVEWLMADYCKSAGDEVFTQTRNDRHTTEIARLNGARMVLVTEVEEGRRWAEAKLKKMTGGDTVTARFMRQDDFEFKPQFKPVISGNHRPRIQDVDVAMRRRMNLVPFAVTIPKEKRDSGLKAKLKEEGPGILQWLIDGCLAYQIFGLNPPAAAVAATDAYFADEDNVAKWVAERCDVGPNFGGSSSELFISWTHYAENARLFIGDSKKFKDEMNRLGYGEKRFTAGMMFEGLRLRSVFVDQEAAAF